MEAITMLDGPIINTGCFLPLCLPVSCLCVPGSGPVLVFELLQLLLLLLCLLLRLVLC
jgi:hypothetical protein